MAYFTEQLQTLQQQVARKKHLEKMLKSLGTQYQGLEERIQHLQSAKLDAQAEADRLEGGSLAAFFYAVAGTKQKKLDKACQEVYAATVKYDAAADELVSVKSQIQKYQQELQSLQGCQERYAKVLREKTEALRTSGTQEAAQILQMEEKFAYYESQKKELGEAITEGQKAQSMASAILSSLNSAEDWGTWDLLGGGLVSSVAKHKHLDSAQWQVERLQTQLGRFRTELEDVTIHADMKLNVDGALRFADYFFDGLFADWAVMGRINRSQEQMQKTYKQISDALSKLQKMQLEIEKQQALVKGQMNMLIEKADI